MAASEKRMPKMKRPAPSRPDPGLLRRPASDQRPQRYRPSTTTELLLIRKAAPSAPSPLERRIIVNYDDFAPVLHDRLHRKTRTAIPGASTSSVSPEPSGATSSPTAALRAPPLSPCSSPATSPLRQAHTARKVQEAYLARSDAPSPRSRSSPSTATRST